MVAGFAEVIEREEILVAVGGFEPPTFDGLSPMRRENVLPQCPICNKAVPLETAKADEYGRAIHEHCYLLKVCLEDATTPSRLRKPR